jgi:hypothetical protein
MSPATTREYKEKGSHDELRIEQQNTRTWNKDKRILRSNTANATDEEHDWEEGEKNRKDNVGKMEGQQKIDMGTQNHQASSNRLELHVDVQHFHQR